MIQRMFFDFVNSIVPISSIVASYRHLQCCVGLFCKCHYVPENAVVAGLQEVCVGNDMISCGGRCYSESEHRPNAVFRGGFGNRNSLRGG